MSGRPGRKGAQFRLVQACVFCGAPGPLTEEHVYGDWLRERVYSGEGVRELTLDGMVRRSQGGPFSKTVKIVCYRCNNVWMSGMETAVEPLLLRMFEGGRVALGQAAQRDLARWAFKTTAVFPYVDQKGGKVPASHRKEFHRADEPPANVVVRIGSASIPTLLGQLAESSFKPRPVQVHHNGATVEVPVYTGRFRLLNVVFEVVGQVPNQWELHIEPTGAAARAMLQIWPISEPVIWWPTAMSLDFFGGLSGLEASEQWQGLPTLVR
jgi:hypothetical protein